MSHGHAKVYDAFINTKFLFAGFHIAGKSCRRRSSTYCDKESLRKLFQKQNRRNLFAQSNHTNIKSYCYCITKHGYQQNLVGLYQDGKVITDNHPQHTHKYKVRYKLTDCFHNKVNNVVGLLYQRSSSCSLVAKNQHGKTNNDGNKNNLQRIACNERFHKIFGNHIQNNLV